MESFAKNESLYTLLLTIFLFLNLSYRKATIILNRMLHRDTEHELILSTHILCIGRKNVWSSRRCNKGKSHWSGKSEEIRREMAENV